MKRSTVRLLLSGQHSGIKKKKSENLFENRNKENFGSLLNIYGASIDSLT